MERGVRLGEVERLTEGSGGRMSEERGMEREMRLGG
jgi:hypothetical protein